MTGAATRTRTSSSALSSTSRWARTSASRRSRPASAGGRAAAGRGSRRVGRAPCDQGAERHRRRHRHPELFRRSNPALDAGDRHLRRQATTLRAAMVSRRPGRRPSAAREYRVAAVGATSLLRTLYARHVRRRVHSPSRLRDARAVRGRHRGAQGGAHGLRSVRRRTWASSTSTGRPRRRSCRRCSRTTSASSETARPSTRCPRTSAAGSSTTSSSTGSRTGSSSSSSTPRTARRCTPG